ncbi:MAG: hypothetical protein AB1631_34060 [Acidobacteriota bacterium]
MLKADNGTKNLTQGKTYEKLLANIREAAHLHFEEIIEAGETISLLLRFAALPL